MRPATWWRALGAATAIAVAGVGAPQGASGQDLDAVAEKKAVLAEEIDRTTAEIDDLRALIDRTRDDLATMSERAQGLERQAAAAEQALAHRARVTFMHGEVTTIGSLLTAQGPQSALERAGILAALSRRDVAALESAGALRRQLVQHRTLLAVTSRELAAYEQRLRERSSHLQDRFQEVSEVYRELKTRRDRQRTIARGAQRGVYACIFSGAFHFRDTWGAPRSGGRRHKGTDVMAPYGAPVYAFTHGVVARFSSSGLGGIGLYLRGDDGVTYYYAHLSGYAKGIRPGRRVEAGQLVAYNGDTGNARGGAPHVHFEIHPRGGRAVNPYPWLTPVC